MKNIFLIVTLLIPSFAFALDTIEKNAATLVEFDLITWDATNEQYIPYTALIADCVSGDIAVTIDGATSSSAVACSGVKNIPDNATGTGRYSVALTAGQTNGSEIHFIAVDSSTPKLWFPVYQKYSTYCGIGETCAFPDEAVTVGDIVVAALAKFASTDSGESTAVAGSIAKLSEGTGISTIDAANITTAAANKLADHNWRRQSANIEASSNGDAVSFKSGYGMIAQQTHKSGIASGVWSIYYADSTTVLKSRNVTSSASAEAITGTD